MTHTDFTWTVPVELQLPCGLTKRFLNPYDAFDFLDAEWPTRRGDAYARAIRLCRIALRSPRATESARAAFIAAGEETGMRQCEDPLRQPSFRPSGYPVC